MITATGALPALTAGAAARHWVFEPVLVAAVVVAAVAYLAGVHRVRTRGGRWPVARTAAFLVAGLGAAILIGALAGLLPALRASRMPPTVALRTA